MTTLAEKCWRCSCTEKEDREDKRRCVTEKRHLDVVKEDMQEVGVRKDEVLD